MIVILVMDTMVTCAIEKIAPGCIVGRVAANLYPQILGLRPTNERGRYFVTASLIGWAQA